MKQINTGTSDFQDIIESESIYVDKTAWFHRLAKAEGRKMFFLARPRRFGKSLMISTLKAMFQGRRDLFEGLAIMDTDWDWEAERRPVIHFNMGKCAAADYETFAAAATSRTRKARCAAFVPLKFIDTLPFHGARPV